MGVSAAQGVKVSEVDSLEPTVEFVQRRPAVALRPLVEVYIGYREVGVAPARHRGLPPPFLTMIVTLDDPIVIAAHPDPRTPPGQYDTLVGGLHTAPALITHDGRQPGVQLAITPLGARTLLGLPAAELAGTDFDAADVLGPFAQHLRERLLAVGTWAERFAILDDLLLARARTDTELPTDIARVWWRLQDTGGTVTVSELAGEVGWSSRHLGNRFRAEIGLGLKEAARMVRFDRARRMLAHSTASGRPLNLAGLAARCGYYDQAHLAREFGVLAGCPPSRWLAEEFRNVQAMGVPAAEDS